MHLLQSLFNCYYYNASNPHRVWHVKGTWKIIYNLNELFTAIESKPTFYSNDRNYFKSKKILFGCTKEESIRRLMGKYLWIWNRSYFSIQSWNL